MAKRIIPESELIINPDGTVFHLHLRPDQLMDNIILVGDPSRVDMVASFFDQNSTTYHLANSTLSAAHTKENP